MNDSVITDEKFTAVSLEDEMRKSYLDYAMSVIVSRALPDIRDGLKPVHRRILYAMREGGYTSDKSYKKSARVVGDVMGKYHPHGDQAIYDALVRMAQDFSLRLPLIDGQGNFGSMDGDPPAAMRYTEARLNKAAEALLEDIDKDTVGWRPNYDESTLEPTVLPSRVPNLLVNGAGGIAVGMATNIPPHNLGEVIDACFAFVNKPDITNEELMDYIPGPDFPTGALILGRTGIRSAYQTGNGSVKVRSKTTIEEIKNGREAIIVNEVPYQVNKGRLLERLGEVGREKVVDDLSEIRDESDRHGVRIVIELKKGANADVVLNQLYKHTALQTSFGCNMVALHNGKPQMLVLRDFIQAFVAFREEVITKRTIFDLGKARDRAHILAGLAVAVANIDAIIVLVRNAKSPNEAKEGLLAKSWPAKEVAPLIALIDDPMHNVDDNGNYKMSVVQAKAILDLRLHRLTGLERDKIGDELKDITNKIEEFLKILASRELLLEVLLNELDEIKTKFATPRRTELVEDEFEEDIEDLIQREDMVVTVTNGGYIKRVPLDTYRAQRRGGKGRSGTSLKDEDFVSDMFVASTHTPILFFTSRGIVHKLKVWQLPLLSPQARGKALINLLPLEPEENISVYMRLPEDEDIWADLDLIFATTGGSIRRNNLSDFKNIRSNGLIAMKLEGEEELVSVKICKPDEDVLLTSSMGKAIRFPVTALRVFSGRTSTGVRGIRLAKGDSVIGMSVVKKSKEGEQGEALLCVSEKGFGKRTYTSEYRTAGRGGLGVINMNVTKKTGKVVATFPVTDDHQIMLVSDQGQMIRIPVNNIRFTGRSAQGVSLFKVSPDEKVVSVAWLIEDDDDDQALSDVEELASLDDDGGDNQEADVEDSSSS